jgi:hypothetical protein
MLGKSVIAIAITRSPFTRPSLDKRKIGCRFCSFVLDELDRRIIHALQDNARASFREVARIARTTPPTAIARIRRLTDLGAILGFHIDIAPWADATPTIQLASPVGGPRCHLCQGALPQSAVELRIAGRAHVFCCTVCRDTMVATAHRMSGWA